MSAPQKVRMTAETHTREEILNEKNQVDAALKAAKQDLADAKRRARASGKFLPVEQFTAIERRIARLAGKSQILQLELTRKKALAAGEAKGFAEHLVDVVSEALGAECASALLDIAHQRAGTKPMPPTSR